MLEEIQKTLRVLKQGKLIIYPTDTVWGIGCAADNFDAINAIYKLKKRNDSKSLICLVSDLKMLQYHVESVPDAAYDILKYTDKPTTIIYDNPIRVAENLIAKDNTLALRIVKSGFAHHLVKKLGKPLVSTSANISGMAAPTSFKEINKEITDGVDYIVKLTETKSTNRASTIIRLGNDGIVNIIRE